MQLKNDANYTSSQTTETNSTTDKLKMVECEMKVGQKETAAAFIYLFIWLSIACQTEFA